MSDPVSVAERIAAVLAAGPVPRCTDYVPDNVAVPAGFVSLPDMDYGQDFSGETVATFRVYVLVQKGLDRAAAHLVSPYIAPEGSSSIKTALEADRTLSGAVSSLRVARATVGPIDVAGTAYLGATFTVEVFLLDYYSTLS